MERPLNSLLARLLLGSAIPVVLFIGVALIATAVIFYLGEALRGEEHSREVIRLALLQRQELDQMRLAVRLFPLQRPKEIPESYQKSREKFHHLAGLLAQLTQDNQTQKEQLDTINTLENRWHKIVEAYLRELQPTPGQPLADPLSQAEAFYARATDHGASAKWHSSLPG